MPSAKHLARHSSRSTAGEAELDELFATAPEQFVAARNALAAKRKAAGRASAASEIKGLAKPTVPVWIINRLAREKREEIEALLEAASQLRKAQAGALGRKVSADQLRATAHAEREALATLLRGADQALSSAGRPATSGLLGRVEATLHAYAIGSSDERERLRRGRVAREAQATGFGGLIGAAAGPLPPGGTRPSRPPASDLRRVRANFRQTQREEKRLRAALERAQRVAERLRSRAERLGTEAAKAQSEAAAASRRTVEVRGELEAALERVDRASARLPTGKAG